MCKRVNAPHVDQCPCVIPVLTDSQIIWYVPWYIPWDTRFDWRPYTTITVGNTSDTLTSGNQM